MFARLFAVATLAALAVASPAPLFARDQCNTGPVNCCNSVQPASVASKQIESVFGLVGILAGVTGDVGLGCSPIVGTGANCQQQPVCCTGNKMNGLVNIGCSPINIGA